MNNIKIVEINKTPQYRLCQLIDLAGFRTIISSKNVTLIDKKSSQADKYSDLTFTSLFEAIRAVQPYLIRQFKFVY